MQSRLPTILGKAIEDATREHSIFRRTRSDLAQAIQRMDDLKTDLSGNAKLQDDDEADVALWNKEIAKHFQGN
jgi:damage-control phosphatase, subfamily III